MFNSKLLKTVLALSILANILLILKLRDKDTPSDTSISTFTAQQLENTIGEFTELQLVIFDKLNQKESHKLMPSYNRQLHSLDSITDSYLQLEPDNDIYQDGASLLQAKLNIAKQLHDPFEVSSELQDSLLFGYQNENAKINPTEARLQLVLTRYAAIDYSRRKWNICGPISEGENIVQDSSIIIFLPHTFSTTRLPGDSLHIESVILGEEALPLSRCTMHYLEQGTVTIIQAPARLIRENELLLIKFTPFINSMKSDPVYANYLLHVEDSF